MNPLRHICAASAAIALSGLPCSDLSAQAENQDTAKALKADKLKKALSTMAMLPSLAFETSTTTIADNPFVRRAGGRASKKSADTNGLVSGDILMVNLNDDADQVVVRGRRMIAKNDKRDWVLRRGRLADGSTLPFLFDPQLFFSSLSQLPLKVMHKEVGTANNKPVETYTFSLSGETARNLVWGGAIPEGSTGGGGAGVMRVVMIGGAGGPIAARGGKGQMIVDVAVSLDPATSLVHQVKVRTYSKAQNAFAVMGGGPFGGGEDEDEDEEKEAEEFDPKNPKFKAGLPVRKKKGKTFVKFDLAITQHNSAVLPDLDRRARVLLNVPR